MVAKPGRRICASAEMTVVGTGDAALGFPFEMPAICTKPCSCGRQVTLYRHLFMV